MSHLLTATHADRVPTVAVVDVSGRDSAKAQLSLLSNFIGYHLAPVWGCPAKFIAETFVPDNAWGLLLANNKEEAEDHGYFGLTPGGLPLEHVYLSEADAAGVPASVAVCKAAAELLSNPCGQSAVMDAGRNFRAVDVCEPVAGSFFDVDGRPVPNFVHPAWYRDSVKSSGVLFDRENRCTRPLEILPTGATHVLDKAGYKRTYRDGADKDKLDGTVRRVVTSRGWLRANALKLVPSLVTSGYALVIGPN